MRGQGEAGRPEDAVSFVRLRGDRPQVMRLSRRAIAASSALGLALVGTALIFALQPPEPGQHDEQFRTGSIALAEGLASAPADYTQIPRLGPPLPGDLGKPILGGEHRGALAELPPAGAAASRTDERNSHGNASGAIGKEGEEARGSRLFFGITAHGALDEDRGAPAADSAAVPTAGPATAASPAETRTIVHERFEAAPSQAILQAGSIIPAALITGIRSDQPGLVVAQVTENVYDSLTGQILLIEQGARLIGDYASEISFGQRRILLAWNRLIFADGRTIMLEHMHAADPSGYAGLEDGVNYHWGGVVKAALVSSLLGAGGELGAGEDSDIARALRRGSQDSINRAGEQIVSRELNIRPSLTIRPGFPVRALVSQDLVMEER